MWYETLVKIKKESGKTIKQISEESGVPLGTLNKLFAGKTENPKLETIKAVVHCLGHTLEDLAPKTEKAPVPSNDDTGAMEVDEVINAFVSAGLVPSGRDLTDSDLRFLTVVIGAINSWFEN